MSAGEAGRTARVREAVALGAVALSTAILMAGCANLEVQDFCTQYADLVVAVDELRDQPLRGRADDIRAAAKDVGDELDQFQAVAEGRLDDALTRMRDNVDALRQAAVDAGEDARQTAAPLLEESVQNVRDAWVAVQSIAETQCPAAD